MEARSLRRGYVAGNLIAAFVTGADGNFDAVIKIFSFRYSLIAYSVFIFMCFIVCDEWCCNVL